MLGFVCSTEIQEDDVQHDLGHSVPSVGVRSKTWVSFHNTFPTKTFYSSHTAEYLF